jgi:predicted Fe-Mo cluster-binding NifX family protein
MKIVLTVSSSSIDAEFDPRFGRCPIFLSWIPKQ